MSNDENANEPKSRLHSFSTKRSFVLAILGATTGVLATAIALSENYVFSTGFNFALEKYAPFLLMGAGTISLMFLMLSYLGTASWPDTQKVDREIRTLAVEKQLEDVNSGLRGLRNLIMHQPSGPHNQLDIDESFKAAIIERLSSQSAGAISEFVKGEVFKAAAGLDAKDNHQKSISNDIVSVLDRYRGDAYTWRRNANLNLTIGLFCAIAGIGVMWMTIDSIRYGAFSHETWRMEDTYRILSRLGLVLVIESVAFFFLKLYREDRNMIRYLRNEITNLETRYLALKTALALGTPKDVAGVIQSLSSTERNFLVKKGERVIAELSYENNEIFLEKVADRCSDILSSRRSRIADARAEGRIGQTQ